MNARQAKEIVREWVKEQGSRIPGFAGAFFHGSINDLAEEDPLPASSDVDVMLVADNPPQKIGKLLYQGVIIEASTLAVSEIRTPEQVLGVSHLAGSLRSGNLIAGGSLIADPSGQLSRLIAEVSRDFAKMEWVTRRCEHALRKARSHLSGFDDSLPFHDQVISWLFGTGLTTHVLLAAGLMNPTVRKRYLAVRELLAAYGRADFYETLLELLGCALISQSQAEQHLAALADAFDAARTVIRSPFPFAADISQLARPVAIDGSRELIECGDQREAMFWMAVTFSRCLQVLSLDGTPAQFERHDPAYRALLADLGIRSSTDLRMRAYQVEEMLPTVWETAETILAANPEIIRG